MLFISTALYIEAQPWITSLSLRQQHDHTRFSIFTSDNVCLIITGTGELKASIAITYLFTHYVTGPHDLLLNFGLCGAKDTSIPIGTAYLCHKIKDYGTKRDLYPDMLMSLPFLESSIETCPCPVGSVLAPDLVREPLFDMESYAVMFAATYYMQPQQMMFLKVVSDHADVTPSHQLSKDQLTAYLSDAVNRLLDCLSANFPNQNYYPNEPEPITLTSLEKEQYDTISEQLHLSATMKHTLMQHITYYKCRHTLAEALLSSFVQDPAHRSCKSKAEGKQYFEQLKSSLME